MRSLRAKLILFSVLLVLVPGLVFAFMAIASVRRALEYSVGRQLAEVAHDTAAEMSEMLGREQRNIGTWARQGVMREIAIGDLDKQISRFLLSLKESDAYLDLLCTDASGRVVASSNATLLGASFAGAPWASSSLAGRSHLAGPVDWPGYPDKVLEIAVPIYDPDHGGSVIGALLGLYDWRRGTAFTSRIQRNSAVLDLRVDVLVIDDGGRVIAAAPTSGDRDLLGRDLRAAGWVSAQPQPPAPRRGYLREPRADVLLGFAGLPLGRPQWTTLVTQPVNEAFAPVYRLQRRLLLVLGGVFMAAVGVAVLLSDRMSRPLRALIAATREMARTGAARTVSARSHDEIGELARAFNQMTARLKQAQEELVGAAKFAFVGEVAAGVAHEVRTPLSIMRSSAQLLGRALPPDQPQSAELIEMIVGETDRLERVVARLLELARPQPPAIEPTSLAAVLERAAEFAEAQACKQGVRIHRRTAGAPAALCDPRQIYQVALNLVVNALQAMPSGGEITLRAYAGPLGRVGFEVRDNGPGISPEVRERIFTPFFTSREGGTGLGLALVQRMVQAQHGTVTVSSELGIGSIFRVDLPAAEEAT